jgi:CRISPR-associated endonuclease/helicase Cas3
MDLVAHTQNGQGVQHLLLDHLQSVGGLAADCAAPFGCSQLARLAGLWHDAGKCSTQFQDYLRAQSLAEVSGGKAPRRGSVRHSPAGALCALERGCQLAAWLIAGHHAGLHSRAALKSRLEEWGQSDEFRAAAKTATAELVIQGPSAEELREEQAGLGRLTPWDGELLLRMMFSALVDADWLDTEGHRQPELRGRRGAYPQPDVLLARWSAYMERFNRVPDSERSPVDRMRHEVRLACVERAALPPGLFRLMVPTGGGKTLSSLGFALTHAVKHQLRRVVMAIPYTSIIEQTAQTYREALRAEHDGQPAVVEHHSALAEPAKGNGDEREDDELLERQRLASENWDAPLIVTTTVQLFDSLFSNRPSACRKLHNLARSVIVLDEAQTLPIGMWEPIVSVLETLVIHCGCTVVLCTATQPALSGESRYLKGFLHEPVDIVPGAERHFVDPALRRVDYCVEGESWSWERVAAEVREHPQCLAVLNTKRDALAVLDALGERGELERLGVLHLSTLLCGAHRRDAIAEVKRRLNAGEAIRLVSTQVVEAGVDVDFPVVLRALGPLDSIVQAAGRCNREGLLKNESGELRHGRVVVFTPADLHLPRDLAYRARVDEARKVLALENADLHDPALYERYFRLLAQDIEPDGKRIQEARKALDYPAVAERGRLIDDETEPVLVEYKPHEAEHAGLLAQAKQLASANLSLTRQLWRKLHPYLVSLPHYEIPRLEHLIDRQTVPGVLLWRGGYDGLRGLTTEGINPESLVC